MRATGSAVEACSLPGRALLARYASAGGYTDCYRAEVAGSVSLAAFVTSFYTGGLFRIERFVLSALLSPGPRPMRKRVSWRPAKSPSSRPGASRREPPTSC